LDLYNGLPGVALFLAYLGDITGESRFTTLAQATTTTLQQADPAGVLGGIVGGLEGWGGVLFTLAHLGRLWDRSALLAGAKMITNALPALIEKDEALDLSAGTAGCLAGLLCLQSTAPSGSVLTAAVRCGEHLLARAQTVEGGPGLCWKPSLPASAPLTGFANGAAGIAWALSELAVVTGEKRFQETAEQALAYERNLFSAEAGNWPDLRIHDPGHPPEAGSPPEFALTWAHGAPGIGLSRLQILRRQEDPLLRRELEVAVNTTLSQGLGQNHSLGQGDLGNLDLLFQAAEFLNDAQLHAEATRWAGRILESIQRLGPRCASPQQIETPGLMTGLAGIGLGLLRLAEPSQVPSVLVFAPPVKP
jgi:type 2 lantibiotic biosynthesis protein LanM